MAMKGSDSFYHHHLIWCVPHWDWLITQCFSMEKCVNWAERYWWSSQVPLQKLVAILALGDPELLCNAIASLSWWLFFCGWDFIFFF